MQNSSKNISIEELEKTSETPQAKLKTSTFDIKNYLNVKLSPKEESRNTKIRLLTVDKDSNKPFEHIYMHTIKVPTEVSESGWKSYVCLEKTHGEFSETLGTKCPFCELRRDAYKKYEQLMEDAKKLKQEGKYDEAKIAEKEAETNKKISVGNIPNEVGIIRCIERGHEEDGPKFWKFTLRKDKKDAESVIRRLYKTRKEECIEEGIEVENILDIDKGYDFKVEISAVYDNNGKKTNKTSTSIERFGSMKPLTTDQELRDKWVNDEKKWSDVFVAKPYEYLEVIIDGGIPWFDKKSGKWIPKSKFEKNTGVKPDEVDKDMALVNTKEQKLINQAENVHNDESSDDGLPF